MPITPILPVIAAMAPVETERPAARAESPFATLFQDAVRQVEQFQQQASTSAERFLNGEGEEIHQVALDAQRAELALDLFLQTRNRVVEAYQEIMRLPM